jgi:hypothetical protein
MTRGVLETEGSMCNSDALPDTVDPRGPKGRGAMMRVARGPSLAGVLAFTLLASIPLHGYADHERLVVGTMRDTDPIPGLITWIEGTCAPSHDRQRLDCYFTTVSVLQMKRTEDEVKRDYEQAIKELNADPEKMIGQFRDLCGKISSDYLKHFPGRERSLAAMRTFCERSTRESLLNLLRVVIDDQAKTCRCDVGDWRAVFERREDTRWIARLGPSPPCSAMRFLTFIPVKPITEWRGVILGRLTDKRVITNVACAEAAKEETRSDPSFRGTLDVVRRLPLSPILSDGEITFSWDAPNPTLSCHFFEFRSMNQLGAVWWGPWPPRVPEFPSRLP